MTTLNYSARNTVCVTVTGTKGGNNMTEVFIYETERAIVRIHPSKKTPEQFRADLEAACRKFYSDIQKESKKENKNHD